MRTANLALFLLATLGCWAATIAVRFLAVHHRLLDRNEARNIIGHRAVPRVGGIGCAAVFFVLGAVAVALLPDQTPLRDPRLWLIGLGVFAVGLWDDLRSLGARYKLAALLVAGALAARCGVAVTSVPLLDVPLGGTASCIATALWFAAVGSAWNFIDGLDGLCSGLCMTTALPLAFLALPGDTYFASILAGVAFGFLLHNRHPATIFMGDSGSFFFGFWISVLGLRVAEPHPTSMYALSVLVAFGWPLADLLWAVSCRLRRRAMFRAGADHLHYLLHARLGHRQSVLTALAVGSGCGLFAVVPHVSSAATAVLALFLAVVLLVAARASVLRPVAVVAMYFSLWSARIMTGAGDARPRSGAVTGAAPLDGNSTRHSN